MKLIIWIWLVLLMIIHHTLSLQSYNPGYNIISSITNLVHESPHELPYDLRPRILGNQEILEKCQMWVQTQPNAQSSFQKLNLVNSCQKTCKIRYYIFEVLPNFIVSLYFVPNILSRIVDAILKRLKTIQLIYVNGFITVLKLSLINAILSRSLSLKNKFKLERLF